MMHIHFVYVDLRDVFFNLILSPSFENKNLVLLIQDSLQPSYFLLECIYRSIVRSLHLYKFLTFVFNFVLFSSFRKKTRMGKGGHNPALEGDHQQQLDTTILPTDQRFPTLSEIKVKIPAHCFRPTVRQSMSYVIKDIIYVALTFFFMYQTQKLFKYGFLFFPIYWYIQGLLISLSTK